MAFFRLKQRFNLNSHRKVIKNEYKKKCSYKKFLKCDSVYVFENESLQILIYFRIYS